MHDGIASEVQDHVIQIRTAMQTSATVKKSVLYVLMQEKWGNYNCSPMIHCIEMACLSLGFSAAPKAIGEPIIRAHYRKCLLLELLLQQSSDHAWLLVHVCNMSEFSHIVERPIHD